MNNSTRRAPAACALRRGAMAPFPCMVPLMPESAMAFCITTGVNLCGPEGAQQPRATSASTSELGRKRQPRRPRVRGLVCRTVVSPRSSHRRESDTWTREVLVSVACIPIANPRVRLRIYSGLRATRRGIPERDVTSDSPTEGSMRMWSRCVHASNLRTVRLKAHNTGGLRRGILLSSQRWRSRKSNMPSNARTAVCRRSRGKSASAEQKLRLTELLREVANEPHPPALSHVTRNIEAAESILASRAIWANRCTQVSGDAEELRAGEELAERVVREMVATERRPRKDAIPPGGRRASSGHCSFVWLLR